MSSRRGISELSTSWGDVIVDRRLVIGGVLDSIAGILSSELQSFPPAAASFGYAHDW